MWVCLHVYGTCLGKGVRECVCVFAGMCVNLLLSEGIREAL